MSLLDENIACNLADGSEEAFTYIYNTYSFKLLNFAKQFVTAADSEDIVADVFTKLWALRLNIKGVNNIEAFLFRSTKNACLDALKSYKVRTSKLEEITHHLGTLEKIDAGTEIYSEFHKLVMQNIRSLPEQCQRVFVFAYMEGLKNREIAQAMNITEKTVSNQKSKAVQILKLSTSIVSLIFPLMMAISHRFLVISLIS